MSEPAWWLMCLSDSPMVIGESIAFAYSNELQILISMHVVYQRRKLRCRDAQPLNSYRVYTEFWISKSLWNSSSFRPCHRSAYQKTSNRNCLQIWARLYSFADEWKFGRFAYFSGAKNMPNDDHRNAQCMKTKRIRMIVLQNPSDMQLQCKTHTSPPMKVA